MKYLYIALTLAIPAAIAAFAACGDDSPAAAPDTAAGVDTTAPDDRAVGVDTATSDDMANHDDVAVAPDLAGGVDTSHRDTTAIDDNAYVPGAWNAFRLAPGAAIEILSVSPVTPGAPEADIDRHLPLIPGASVVDVLGGPASAFRLTLDTAAVRGSTAPEPRAGWASSSSTLPVLLQRLSHPSGSARMPATLGCRHGSGAAEPTISRHRARPG